jgi:hypothetical protein
MRNVAVALTTLAALGAAVTVSAQAPRTKPATRPLPALAQPTPTPVATPRSVAAPVGAARVGGQAVKLLPTATPTPTPFAGFPCKVDRDCESGACFDGICCDQKCDGNCRSCALPGHVGICTAVPDGLDPRRACQVAIGGTPACGGACYGGQCAFPDVGTPCGICAACDGNGRCTAAPADDARCGVVDCSRLDTACRIYQDLTANRCAALGLCKTANDPATCNVFTDLRCP